MNKHGARRGHDTAMNESKKPPLSLPLQDEQRGLGVETVVISRKCQW